jgi:hypothetical protein
MPAAPRQAEDASYSIGVANNDLSFSGDPTHRGRLLPRLYRGPPRGMVMARQPRHAPAGHPAGHRPGELRPGSKSRRGLSDAQDRRSHTESQGCQPYPGFARPHPYVIRASSTRRASKSLVSRTFPQRPHRTSVVDIEPTFPMLRPRVARRLPRQRHAARMSFCWFPPERHCRISEPHWIESEGSATSVMPARRVVRHRCLRIQHPSVSLPAEWAESWSVTT